VLELHILWIETSEFVINVNAGIGLQGFNTFIFLTYLSFLYERVLNWFFNVVCLCGPTSNGKTIGF